MTRTEKIDEIAGALPTLDSERLEFLGVLVSAWSNATVFDSLEEPRRAALRDAMERMKAGRKVPAEQMFDAMAARIDAAGL